MNIAAVTCHTPIGPVTSSLRGGVPLQVVPTADGVLRWHGDAVDVELVVGRPSYPDVVFQVDEHIGWRWRVVVHRDVADLVFQTHVRADGDGSAGDDEPIDAPWICGVLRQTPTHTWGIATADRDALSIRHADERWLPQRYLEDEDPLRPGVSSIVTRSASGIDARFDAPRGGESFEHTAVMAWHTGSARGSVIDALDVDGDSIARGAILAAPGGEPFGV